MSCQDCGRTCRDAVARLGSTCWISIPTDVEFVMCFGLQVLMNCWRRRMLNLENVDDDKRYDDWNWRTFQETQTQLLRNVVRQCRGAWNGGWETCKVCTTGMRHERLARHEETQSRMCRVGGRHLMHTHCGVVLGERDLSLFASSTALE